MPPGLNEQATHIQSEWQYPYGDLHIPLLISAEKTCTFTRTRRIGSVMWHRPHRAALHIPRLSTIFHTLHAITVGDIETCAAIGWTCLAIFNRPDTKDVNGRTEQIGENEHWNDCAAIKSVGSLIFLVRALVLLHPTYRFLAHTSHLHLRENTFIYTVIHFRHLSPFFSTFHACPFSSPHTVS